MTDTTWDAPITKDLTLAAFDKICRDIRNQPRWRFDSDTDADYYDGAQTSAEVARRLKEAGIPAQDSNFIKPTINAVLGMEARSRTDYKITADDEQQDEIAEGLSARIKEVETESRADRAMSDAYSSMMRAGLGWIEVSREFDPLKYPYRVREIHRNEIYWDWTSKEPDMSDARYLRRDKWSDRSQVLSMFPECQDLIQATWNGWATLDVYDGTDSRMVRAYEAEQTWSRQDEDYLNRSSGMVRLTELWYRHFEDAFVLTLPNGRAIEFNERNPAHVQAVARGLVEVQRAMLSRTRVSIWLGPHKLMDIPTPLPHNDFPYIPFWCFRKDRSRVPYGLIRDMRGPQDQILDLDIQLYEVMNSVKIEIDNDALDLNVNTLEEVARNANNLRSVTVLNAGRRNANGYRVMRDQALAAQVYQLVEERKKRIEQVSGVFRAMLGQSTESTSGVAISNLVEQGSTVLAEPNDNFRYARRLCGQQLLALIIHDMIGRPQAVSVQQGVRQKKIYFNRPYQDAGGNMRIENDIEVAQVKVVLEDIPASASFRAQQLAAFSQMVQAAPPAYQAVLYPAMLELSDVPNRHELADQLRKVGNVPSGTPEEEQQQAQQAQIQQQIQQKMVELEIAQRQATVQKTQAEAQRLLQPEGGGQGQADGAHIQQIRKEIQAMQRIAALQQEIAALKGELSVKTVDQQLKARELDIKEQAAGMQARLKAEQITVDDLVKREKMNLEERIAEANLAAPDTKFTNVAMSR